MRGWVGEPRMLCYLVNESLLVLDVAFAVAPSQQRLGDGKRAVAHGFSLEGDGTANGFLELVESNKILQESKEWSEKKRRTMHGTCNLQNCGGAVVRL